MATKDERRRPGRGRLAAAGFSLLVHAGLLAALLASVRTLSLPPGPPPLEVQLVRPVTAEGRVRQAPPDRRPQPAPGQAPSTRLPPVAARPQISQPSVAVPLPAPQPAPTPGPPAPAQAPGRRPAASPGSSDDVHARVRSALRTTVGCDDDAVIGLSPAERAACDRRRAQTGRGAPKAPLPSDKLQAWGRKPPTRNAHAELRPDWDCAAGGSLSCRGSGVMVGGSIPFGYVPKALPPIPPSTLHGNDGLPPKEPPR